MSDITTDPALGGKYDTAIITMFDFSDAPPMGHTAVAFGGNIEQVDDRTFRLNWSDGVANHWSEDLPDYHAAHAYLGHLIDFVFRGQYFEETVDEWLIRHWYERMSDWAYWHYRHLLADLASQGIEASDMGVEDMGGGSWAVVVHYGPNRFAWIDDADTAIEGYRCFLYESTSPTDAIEGSSEGETVSYEKAVRLAVGWKHQAEYDRVVGEITAIIEDSPLPFVTRQRALFDVADTLARKEG